MFLSCTSNTMYKEPADLIPKDSMVLLLTDMYIAISAKNTKHKSTNKKNDYLPLVYEKYTIDSTRFYKSNNFYTSKIEDYSEILGIVKSNIKKKHTIFETELNFKDSIKKAKKLEKTRIKDSIKKAKLYIKRLPRVLKKPVVDTLFFYENKAVYLSNLKEYNHIIIDMYDLEEEILNDSEENKSKKDKVDENSTKKKATKDEEDEKPLVNKDKKGKKSTENKVMKGKKEKDSIASLKLKKIKAKLKKNALKNQDQE